MTDSVKAPRSAEFFSSMLIADRELRDEVIGDLTEEYHNLSHSASPATATWWYWSQLVRSAIPLSNMAVSRGGWRGWTRHALGVVAGAAVMWVIVVSGELLNGRLRGVVMTPTSPWRLRLVFAPPLFGVQPPAWLVGGMSLATIVFAGAISSYVAATVGRRSPLAPAMTLCTVCVGLLYVLPLLLSGGVAEPVWPFAWLLVGVMGGVVLKARALSAEVT